MSNPILEHFTWEHLPEHLQPVSRQFGILAHWIDNTLPDGPEKSVALRKVLEGKDAAVRAALPMFAKGGRVEGKEREEPALSEWGMRAIPNPTEFLKEMREKRDAERENRTTWAGLTIPVEEKD